MVDVLHRVLGLGENHIIQDSKVANAAARDALSVTTADIGRVVQLASDDTFWILNKVAGGVVWSQVDASGLTPAQIAQLNDATAAIGSLGAAPSAPLDVKKQGAAAGSSTAAARADHKHDVQTAAPLPIGGTLSEGVSTALARADHVHTLSSADRSLLQNSAQLSSVAPQPIRKQTADGGVDNGAARVDHKHDVIVSAPVAIGTGTTPTEGTSAFLARADHVHVLDPSDRAKIDAATPVLASTAPVAVKKQTAAAGVSSNAARADHVHDVSTAVPVAIGAANAEGTSDSLARADHVHALSTADRAKVDGAAVISTTAPPSSDAGAPSGGTLAAGAAARDHKHQILVAAPTFIGTGASNAAGTSDSLARADHVHALDAADRAKIDGAAAISTAAPAAVDASAAYGGTTASGAAAQNHRHSVATGTPVAIGTGASSTAGTSDSLARSDHVHALATADRTKLDNAATVATTTPTTSDAGAASGGTTAAGAAAADHKHTISTAAPVAIGTANAAGAAASLSRSDHVHDHGSLAGGTLHALATAHTATPVGGVNTTGGTHGFISADLTTKLVGLTDSSTKADAAFTVNAQTGTSYTLVLADGNSRWVEMQNAGANTVFVPQNSSVALPLMTPITIARAGTGATTITAGANVTLLPANNMVIDVQYGVATIVQRTANVWWVTGQVV